MRRAVDVVVSSTALVVLSPVLAVIAVLVRLRLGSPVLFRQERPGLHGEPFTIVKFRTMRDAFDGDGVPLPDEDRMTRFGNLLRSTSLDELPELVNVLRGDMTLIGPRPLKMEYLPLYTPEQARRHDVRPGITGLAQVSGRNSLIWDEKFTLDVEYVDTRCLALDLKILWRTVVGVVKRDGISSEGFATAPRFEGSVDEGADVRV
jgi:lipopolysaccharide/colanic/teichoic acid biosynthesis glycosyltransferase